MRSLARHRVCLWFTDKLCESVMSVCVCVRAFFNQIHKKKIISFFRTRTKNATVRRVNKIIIYSYIHVAPYEQFVFVCFCCFFLFFSGVCIFFSRFAKIPTSSTTVVSTCHMLTSDVCVCVCVRSNWALKLIHYLSRSITNRDFANRTNNSNALHRTSSSRQIEQK